MNKTVLLLLVLMGILIILAGIQTFQLSAVSQALSNGVTTVSASSGSGSALSSLPSQVGGC